MADIITREARSRNMGRIRSRNTTPELLVRSFLHKVGFRYRLHDSKLPGKPDVVLPQYKTVIEVRGCFWHRHAGCQFAYFPKSNRRFWKVKFLDNVKRDARNTKALRKTGWKVIIVWECQIRNVQKLGLLEKRLRASRVRKN